MTEENKEKWLALIASKRLGHYSCDICETQGDLRRYGYTHAVIVNICKKHARELDLIW